MDNTSLAVSAVAAINPGNKKPLAYGKGREHPEWALRPLSSKVSGV